MIHKDTEKEVNKKFPPTDQMGSINEFKLFILSNFTDNRLLEKKTQDLKDWVNGFDSVPWEDEVDEVFEKFKQSLLGDIR